MGCIYCAQYIKRALAEVENFEKACTALRLNPHNPSEAQDIMKALGGIGQFGTIRLARRFPFVTDEEQFQMVARTGLNFYWMMLDFWEERRAKDREQREASAAAAPNNRTPARAGRPERTARL